MYLLFNLAGANLHQRHAVLAALPRVHPTPRAQHALAVSTDAPGRAVPRAFPESSGMRATAAAPSFSAARQQHALRR